MSAATPVDAERPPFARVRGVAAGSAGETAGVCGGDELLLFGTVCYESAEGNKDFGAYFKPAVQRVSEESAGSPVKLVVRREEHASSDAGETEFTAIEMWITPSPPDGKLGLALEPPAVAPQFAELGVGSGSSEGRGYGSGRRADVGLTVLLGDLKEADPSSAPARKVESPPQALKRVAGYSFEAEDETELSFEEGDVIVVLDGGEESGSEWWMGENERTGERGIFPSNYTEPFDDESMQSSFLDTLLEKGKERNSSAEIEAQFAIVPDSDSEDDSLGGSALLETGIIIPNKQKDLLPRLGEDGFDDPQWTSTMYESAESKDAVKESQQREKIAQRVQKEQQKEQQKQELAREKEAQKQELAREKVAKASSEVSKDDEVARLKALGIGQQFHVGGATVATVILEGLLEKKGDKRKNWKLRYWRLIPRALEYYNKESDEEPIGVVRLTPDTLISEKPSMSKANRHVFDVQADRNEKRVFHIAAANTKLREKWMKVLLDEVQRLRADRESTEPVTHKATVADALAVHKTVERHRALHDGILKKKSGTAWKSRFLLLFPGQVYYFENAAAGNALGVIPLLNVTLQVTSTGKRHQISIGCPLHKRTYVFSGTSEQLVSWQAAIVSASVTATDEEQLAATQGKFRERKTSFLQKAITRGSERESSDGSQSLGSRPESLIEAVGYSSEYPSAEAPSRPTPPPRPKRPTCVVCKELIELEPITVLGDTRKHERCHMMCVECDEEIVQGQATKIEDDAFFHEECFKPNDGLAAPSTIAPAPPSADEPDLEAPSPVPKLSAPKVAPKLGPKLAPKIGPKGTPKFGPKVGPKGMGPKVGPKMGPKVGPKMGPKMGPKAGPKAGPKSGRPSIKQAAGKLPVGKVGAFPGQAETAPPIPKRPGVPFEGPPGGRRGAPPPARPPRPQRPQQESASVGAGPGAGLGASMVDEVAVTAGDALVRISPDIQDSDDLPSPRSKKKGGKKEKKDKLKSKSEQASRDSPLFVA